MLSLPCFQQILFRFTEIENIEKSFFSLQRPFTKKNSFMKSKRKDQIVDQTMSGTKDAPLFSSDFTGKNRTGQDESPIQGLKRCAFSHDAADGTFGYTRAEQSNAREITDYITLLTSHLGALPAKSAQFTLSPLMESKLSAQRNGLSVIAYENIKIQLIKVLYSIASILRSRARILIIDPTDLSKQVILDSQVKGGVASRGDLIFSQGPWKAGTCSNWSQVQRKIWNWAHSLQFFGHSKRKLGDSVERVLQKKETSLWSGRKCLENNSTPGKRRGWLEPRLFYEKKPDLILLLTSEKNRSLIGEAQALKVPLIYLADTDFNDISYKFALERPGYTFAGGEKRFHRIQPSGGAYPWIINSESFSFHFLFSSLLAQLLSLER